MHPKLVLLFYNEDTNLHNKELPNNTLNLRNSGICHEGKIPGFKTITGYNLMEEAELGSGRQFINGIMDGKYDDDKYHYLDFSHDIMYNLSLIKYNPNTFVTTMTGIAVLSDLMYKDTTIVWDDEMKNWVDRPDIETTFNAHFYSNRNCKL